MYGRMELELLREVREKRHFHPEIEVLFVVEGEAQVTLKDLSCQMEKEDVFLINSGVMHYVESAGDALICTVRFPYIRQSHKTECLLTSLLFRLLDCLIEQYGISDNFAEMQENEDDMRLQQIFRYVNENYQTGISLSELADSLFLSTSTLSRFFRKQTGIYFSDYVNQLNAVMPSMICFIRKRA